MMKDVPYFENEYAALDDGRIFSKIFNRFMKLSINGNTYIPIRLCKNGIQYPTRVHRVIAHTFIPNPHNYPQVNHKNGIKTDNRVENLEWISRSDNVKHAYRELGRIRITGKDHPKYKPILDTMTGIFYESCKEAALSKGLTRDQVKSGLRSKGYYRGFLYA